MQSGEKHRQYKIDTKNIPTTSQLQVLCITNFSLQFMSRSPIKMGFNYTVTTTTKATVTTKKNILVPNMQKNNLILQPPMGTRVRWWVWTEPYIMVLMPTLKGVTTLMLYASKMDL